MNSPQINLKTKDYVLLNGQILNTDSIVNRINLALSCPLGSWKLDLNYGCSMYSFLGIVGITVNKRKIEKSVENALQFMIKDGTLKTVTAYCTKLTLTMAEVKLFYTIITGQVYQFVYAINQL